VKGGGNTTEKIGSDVLGSGHEKFKKKMKAEAKSETTITKLTNDEVKKVQLQWNKTYGKGNSVWSVENLDDKSDCHLVSFKNGKPVAYVSYDVYQDTAGKGKDEVYINYIHSHFHGEGERLIRKIFELEKKVVIVSFSAESSSGADLAKRMGGVKQEGEHKYGTWDIKRRWKYDRKNRQ